MFWKNRSTTIGLSWFYYINVLPIVRSQNISQDWRPRDCAVDVNGGLYLFLNLILQYVAIIVFKSLLLKSTSLDIISIISFRSALSATSERLKIDCESCSGLGLTSREPVKVNAPCCYWAGPCSILKFHYINDFRMMIAELYTILRRAVVVRSVSLVFDCRIADAMDGFFIGCRG